MTAPTLVSTTSVSAWDSGSRTKTVSSVAIQSGDLVVVLAGSMDSSGTLATPTMSGVSASAFALKQSYTTKAPVGIWTTQATSSGTATVSMTGSQNYFGFQVEVWRGHGGVGASNKAAGSGSPSLAVTTTASDSAISAINGDWNGVTGTATARTVSGASYTQDAHIESGAAITVGRWVGTGTAGSKTIGWSSPSGQDWQIVGVEIKGVASGSAVHGDSASTITVTGAAAGHAGRRTTATGQVSVAGAAAGHVDRYDSATGAVSVTGGAAATVGKHQTATGSITVTGAASGTVHRYQSASGTIVVTGAAAGTVHRHQTAAGTVVVTGSASGTVHRSSTALATITVTGTASGIVSTPGSSSAEQTVAVTGAASGEVAHHATTAGTITVTGHASGSVSSPASASALAQVHVTGTASGHVGHVGTATGTILIAQLARAASDIDYRVTIRNMRIVGPTAEGRILGPTATGRIPTPTATGGTL